MAITIDDFNKIWASTSPLTPYTFSDANYRQGWNFVGATPPSRQMWDSWLKMTDEKCQYLYNHEDVPVGHEYFTFNPHIPQGSLPLFGGEYSRETYSALWNWVQEQTGYLKTEAEWQTLATANNGNVPYYSDGDGSTTFRVPALNCWMRSANGTVSEVGSYLQAGLPNITGYTIGFAIGGGSTSNQGAVRTTAGTEGRYATGTGGADKNLIFDASHSNSIYGNSSTVQPASVVGMWLVKAYGTVADTGVINEQQYIDDRLGTKLSLTGGTMLAPIGFNALGQIGFRGTTHTDPNDICKQVVVTAGTVDSAWDDGNAKLCLHTYDSTGTNTAENGSFVLQASDGNGNAPFLEGTPNGDLKWSSKSIERVNSSTSEGGEGYIRYENGLQICWGVGTASGTSGGKTISYQVAFNYAPSVTVTAGSLTATASNHVSIQVSAVTTTSFDCAMSVGSAWSTGGFRWIATGTWK